MAATEGRADAAKEAARAKAARLEDSRWLVCGSCGMSRHRDDTGQDVRPHRRYQPGQQKDGLPGIMVDCRPPVPSWPAYLGADDAS